MFSSLLVAALLISAAISDQVDELSVVVSYFIFQGSNCDRWNEVSQKTVTGVVWKTTGLPVCDVGELNEDIKAVTIEQINMYRQFAHLPTVVESKTKSDLCQHGALMLQWCGEDS